MNSCTRALLEGAIDYAGLFPPAALSLAAAWAEYLDHRASSYGWMLARFVCPVGRLAELEPMLGTLHAGQNPVGLSVLGRGGDTLDEFVAATEDDAATVAAFAARNPGASADLFEVKLPAAGGAAVAVEKAWKRLTDGGATPVTPYFEVDLLGDWRPRLPAAAAAVRDTDRKAVGPNRVALKIRCGGLEAAAIPEPMAVAAAIATCRSLGIPLKATQGLHHPFRHHDDSIGAEVHGFLNLFSASVLAHAHDLPVRQLTEVVAEMDPGAFVFSEDRLAWREYEASADEIRAARTGALTSFGSCSFSEPRDDLAALGLITD